MFEKDDIMGVVSNGTKAVVLSNVKSFRKRVENEIKIIYFDETEEFINFNSQEETDKKFENMRLCLLGEEFDV